MVTIHCPHTAETHEMVSAARIGAMKPTAYLINTARGEIVDEKALIAALKTGRIAGAGLDVYTHEPAVDPDLLALDNVVPVSYTHLDVYKRQTGACHGRIARKRGAPPRAKRRRLPSYFFNSFASVLAVALP